MKKIAISCLLIVSMVNVKGQTMASETKWEDNSADNNAHGVIQHDNEFANTEINAANGKISFSDLPDLKKATWAIVTDGSGNIMTQKRINPNESSMDLHRLPKGEMYFLTLVYKNKSKKAFVLHL